MRGAAGLTLRNVAVSFLVFVHVVRPYGAMTVSQRILYVQAIPVLAALLAGRF